MKEQTNGSERRLTINDPVSPETVQQLRQIQSAQADLGLELLRLEQRRIQVLAVAKKLDEQHQRVFQGILVERGLDPTTPVELDGTSGKISMKKPPEAPEAEAQPANP